MNSIDYQPVIQREFAAQGTFFSKHYCTIAICCPSRVSLLTGKAAHNTNVTDVSLPYGGYPKFVSEGWNDRYLPVWLQEAGYNTYYTGKLMNGHSIWTYNDPYPKGWTGTDYLVDPGTYRYYNATMQSNHEEPRQHPDEYSTDLIANSSVSFLDDALAAGEPFFLGVAPIAPHSETLLADDGGVAFYDPIPAERHRNLFPDLKVPRTPHFNHDEFSQHGGFIKTLQKQNDTVIHYNDGFYRSRIQALQAVDEMVEKIMDWLYAHPDVLENTYLMYTTDNGFHIGQHRLPPGKTCAIEEDINIPFFVRGPGVDKGQIVSFRTTHTDIVPTIFELAGMPLRKEFDGEPIPVTVKRQVEKPKRSEHVNVEFWGAGIFEGEITPIGDGLLPIPGLIHALGPNNTYKTVRIISDDYDLSYTVWCSNEHELYDMKTDPHQMHNLLHGNWSNHPEVEVSGFEISKLVPRVDALLLTLKTCEAEVCIRPWETLHPTGNVKNLKDAMNPKYDEFYLREQRRVTFSGCAYGYIKELEGALEPLPYPDEHGRIRRRGRWEDFA